MKINSKFNLCFLAFLMAVLAFSSCQKNKPDNETTDEVLEPFAMVYSDFILPDDVQILTSDTTKISISEDFVKKMGIEKFEGRAVSIWRTINTPPFFRKITATAKEGNRLILTTVRGEMADMFENLDVEMESDLYINRNFTPTKVTRGASNIEVDDVSGKYIDEDGVIHPAVIIVEPYQSQPSALHQSLVTRAGVTDTKNYYTAEELLQSNVSFDIFRVKTAIEFEKNLDEDDDDIPLKFMGVAGVEAYLSAELGIKISWFRLKKFEASVSGGAKLEAKLGVGIAEEWKKEWKTTLMSFGKTHLVFWVGIIPVPFTVEPKIEHKTKAKAEASVQILTTTKIESSFKVGCRYADGGWRDIGEPSRFDKSFTVDGLVGSASVEASTGIYITTDLLLLGSVGPSVSVGPEVGIGGSIESKIGPEEVSTTFDAEAYVGIMGELGAKAEFLGYSLGEWKTKFSLFKVPIFNTSLSFTYDVDGGYDTVKGEWSALADEIKYKYTN